MGQLKYRTIAGDTLDMIALDMYNNEFLAHLISEANPQYANIVVFDEGIVLNVSVIEDIAIPETLPPWRR